MVVFIATHPYLLIANRILRNNPVLVEDVIYWVNKKMNDMRRSYKNIIIRTIINHYIY